MPLLDLGARGASLSTLQIPGKFHSCVKEWAPLNSHQLRVLFYPYLRNKILSVKTSTREDLPAIGRETCTQMWGSDPPLQFDMYLLFYPNQTHMSCTSCPTPHPIVLGHRQQLPQVGICILGWVNFEIFFLSVNLLINIKMKSDLTSSLK